MKKTSLLISVLVLLTYAFIADAAVIKNKLNQRITVRLSSGKSISLLAQGTAEVSEQDIASTELKKGYKMVRSPLSPAHLLQENIKNKKKNDFIIEVNSAVIA